MPRRSVRLAALADDLLATFASIRSEVRVPETFSPEVLAEAEASSRRPAMPEADLTDVLFVTV
ncbi:MAG: RNB domain-containing ribonuclease, partial [Actinomycetota bacterium]